MGLIRLTTTAQILTTEDIAAHTNVDATQDGDYLDTLQQAAVSYIEERIRSQIGVGTFTLTIDRFPRDRQIRIPQPPLKSVESIQYLDPSGLEVALDPSAYRVDVSERPGRVLLKSGQSWPATLNEPASVTIQFTAGYDEDEYPEYILHLIRLVCGSWYENREGVVEGRFEELPLPFAVSTLINMHAFPEA